MATAWTHRPGPHPERVTLQLRVAEDLTEDDAGWSFWAYIQLFAPVVNDRFMRFHPGAFLKTFKERIPTGSIKLHDGHNWGMTAGGTIGRILEGKEDAKGALIKSFVSAAHPEIATKLRDGTLTEFSAELFRMKQDLEGEAPIEDIPEHARRFAELLPNGKVRVADIFEVRMDAAGLVSGSSQGRNIMVEPPTVLPFADLPVARTNFDPAAAAERLAAWAGTDASRQTPAGEPMPNYCRLSRGYLACVGGELLGQIADVDSGGKLIVPLDALDVAYDHLAEALVERLDEPARRATLAAAARQIGHYEGIASGTSWITAEATPTESPSPAASEPSSVTLASAAETEDLTAEAAPSTLEEETTAPAGAEPPDMGTHSDDGATEAAEGLERLEADIQLLELERSIAELAGVRPHEPARTGGKRQQRGPTELR